MAWTDERLEERFNGIDRRFDEVDRRFDSRSTGASNRWTGRFEQVDRRFDRVEGEIVELRHGIGGLQTTLNRIGGSMVVGLMGVIAADPRSKAAELAAQPPIGARGFAPQKTTVPSMPMMWTTMMLKTIDFAVAVPTPTGPPEAV